MNLISSYLLGILQKNIEADAPSPSKGSASKTGPFKGDLVPGKIIEGRVIGARNGFSEIDTDQGVLRARGELSVPRQSRVRLRVLDRENPPRVKVESWEAPAGQSATKAKALLARSKVNLSRLFALTKDGALPDFNGLFKEMDVSPQMKKAMSFWLGFFKPQKTQDAHLVKLASSLSKKALSGLIDEILEKQINGKIHLEQNGVKTTQAEKGISSAFFGPSVGASQKGEKAQGFSFEKQNQEVPVFDEKEPKDGIHEDKNPGRIWDNESLETAPKSKSKIIFGNDRQDLSKMPSSAKEATFLRKTGLLQENAAPEADSNKKTQDEFGKGLLSSDSKGDGEHILNVQQDKGRLVNEKAASLGRLGADEKATQTSKALAEHGLSKRTFEVSGTFSGKKLASRVRAKFQKDQAEATPFKTEGPKTWDAEERPKDVIQQASLLKEEKALDHMEETYGKKAYSEGQVSKNPAEQHPDLLSTSSSAKEHNIHSVLKGLSQQLGLSHEIQTHFAEKGMNLFALPFFLPDFQGVGQWMFWKDEEGSQDLEKAEAVSHLVFDLCLRNLGQLDIHVLKRDDTVSVFIWAGDDKVKEIRKGVSYLVERLRGVSFNIGDVVVEPRGAGQEDATASALSMMEPSRLHIVT